jgi:large subunit ribosomal protein L31
MQKNIHPKYNPKAKITCTSCGTSFYAGSTQDELSVELCSNCHPFFTGKENIMIDRDDMVKKFKERAEAASTDGVIKKRKKNLERRQARTSMAGTITKLTLSDMLKQAGSK